MLPVSSLIVALATLCTTSLYLDRTWRGACFSVTLASTSIRFIPSLRSFIFKICPPRSAWLVFRGFLFSFIVWFEESCGVLCLFFEFWFFARCLLCFRKVCGMFLFRPRRGSELACWRVQASSAEAAFGAWLLVG